MFVITFPSFSSQQGEPYHTMSNRTSRARGQRRMPPIGEASRKGSSLMPPISQAQGNTIKTSPYMFYHGEPSTDQNEEVPANSPFRNSDLGQALVAVNNSFTDGKVSASLVDINERSTSQMKLRGANEFLTTPKNANLATIHKLVASAVLKEATKVLKAAQNNVNPQAASASSNALYARATTEIRISVLLKLLREEYNITSKALMDSLNDGLQSTNDRLGEGLSVSSVVSSSPTFSSASPGCISFAAFMELVDIYVNGQPSFDTRNACFNVFDVDRVRVITLKHLRMLRGAKESVIKEKTNGGTFGMLKALLDLFQHTEEISGTLTSEQVMPMFDLDEGMLVEGFMEEILRQIAIHEFGALRVKLVHQ